MKFTNTFRFRLPQRTIPQENDPANIDDLNFNATSIDSILKLNADELARLETAKATKSALALHEENKSNPHSVSKAQAGLGNADNTSDINKPVSTAQAAAIKAVQDDVNNHKSDKSNPHLTTKEQIGLGNVPNVATDNQTPTFTQATVLSDLLSGETLTVSLGKLSKAITDLIDHKKDLNNPHKTTAKGVNALPLEGGSLTGFLTLHSTPTANMHAANKKYVDDAVIAAGGGDMTKSVYDVNNNGIVDTAQSLYGGTW